MTKIVEKEFECLYEDIIRVWEYPDRSSSFDEEVGL
jgi:hypothetical protein